MTITAIAPPTDHDRIATLERQLRHERARVMAYENAFTTIRATLASLPDSTGKIDTHQEADYYRTKDKNAAARLLLAATVIRYPDSDLRKRLERVLAILAE